MVLLVLVIFLVALFGGLGMASHLFWVLAGVFAAIYLLGFLLRGAEKRWYRW